MGPRQKRGFGTVFQDVADGCTHPRNSLLANAEQVEMDLGTRMPMTTLFTQRFASFVDSNKNVHTSDLQTNIIYLQLIHND